MIVKAKGVYLWDSEGNKIIDGMAGLWCVNVGYGRKELADAAYRQMQELPYYNTFFKTTHPPVIELSALLAELAPAPFNHFFYCNSGSEGNDTVLRIVHQYWATQGKHAKKYVISRKNGYHGSTIAGGTLGGMGYMHEQMPSKVENIVHIDQPYFFGEAEGNLTPEEFGLARAQQLEAKILEIGAENVAAFIGEPFQGAGGVIFPAVDLLAGNPAHLPQVRHPAGCRRSDRWFRPHRRMVRASALRFRAGPDHARQGSDERLCADGRGRSA